jgi:hypothetical protein
MPETKATGVGTMHPAGSYPVDYKRLGYWPPDRPFAQAKYIFGVCAIGVAIESVATGKTLVLPWTDLAMLANAEGVNVPDPDPADCQRPSTLVGVPAEPEVNHAGQRDGGGLASGLPADPPGAVPPADAGPAAPADRHSGEPQGAG